jgi:predicted RecA/RadA family phage recombinase
MKTWNREGCVLTLTAPTGGVVSGTAYQVGLLVVVATETVAQTLPFEALVKGVVTVPKVNDETWTEGMKVYWDDSAGKFTLDPDTTTNPLVGVAVQPIASPYTVSLASNDADMVVSGMTVTIGNYTGIAGKTITVTINGTPTVLTEGVEFVDDTGNNETATSLAAAISALTGVTATAASAVVTVKAATGATTSSASTGTVRLDGAVR